MAKENTVSSLYENYKASQATGRIVSDNATLLAISLPNASTDKYHVSVMGKSSGLSTFTLSQAQIDKHEGFAGLSKMKVGSEVAISLRVRIEGETLSHDGTPDKASGMEVVSCFAAPDKADLLLSKVMAYEGEERQVYLQLLAALK